MVERAMLTHHALRPGKRGRSFNIVARVAGDHPFRRDQVEAAFTSTLDAMLARWVPATKNASMETWVHVIGDRTIAGIRLSTDAMAQRTYKKAHVPASLKPTVARALVLLAGIRAGDVVVDPMCGVGTILREASDTVSSSTPRDGATSATIVGGDLDPAALAGARTNVGQRTHLAQWDAGGLPLRSGSVSIVVTNPPYGRQHDAHPGLDKLYRSFLREVTRILRRGGRAVVLTGEPRALAEVLPRPLRVRTRRRLLLRGLPVTAFVIVRE
jgi:23S rRNA G2445 N2-methylase RlmL